MSTGWADQTDHEAKAFEVEFQTDPLVRFGPTLLTRGDVDAFLDRRVPEQDRAALLQSSRRLGDIFTNLVLQHAFVHRVEEAGLLDQPVVQARFYHALAQEARRIYREHLFADDSPADFEDAARELFMLHPDQFQGAVSFDFEHLLVSVSPGRSEVDAMREVLRLHELVEQGADLTELAVSYSDDPSVAENGGLFEQITSEMLVGEVAQALSRAEAGQLLSPVRSQFGWHLMVLVARHEPEPATWEEARSRALDVAFTQHRTAVWERTLRDVQDFEPEYFEDGMRQLLQDFGIETADYGEPPTAPLAD